MHSSNDPLKDRENVAQGDSTRDRQLELETMAFAELLLDIYEYRYHEKRKQAASPSTFDGGSERRKMV